MILHQTAMKRPTNFQNVLNRLTSARQHSQPLVLKMLHNLNSPFFITNHPAS
jgi:hypothetical protein